MHKLKDYWTNVLLYLSSMLKTYCILLKLFNEGFKNNWSNWKHNKKFYKALFCLSILQIQKNHFLRIHVDILHILFYFYFMPIYIFLLFNFIHNVLFFYFYFYYYYHLYIVLKKYACVICGYIVCIVIHYFVINYCTSIITFNTFLP